MASPSHSAFFYGTLMAPSVLHRVCHGSQSPTNPIYTSHNLQTTPALLPNHKRHRVLNADYPAIIPTPGASVRGAFVTNLTDGDIWRLDMFEGIEYERVKVRVKLLKGNGEEEVEAETYVWKAGRERLEDREWDFEEFQREKMRFWVGSEDAEEGIQDVDKAVAAGLDQQRDGTGGRGGNGHISNALKEEQDKISKAAV